MVRVFITGSTDGIGQAAAKLLIDQGHEVFLHARNADRAASAQKALPAAKGVLVGDLKSIKETKKLAQDANAAGPFDAIVHNAGIGYGSTSSREVTSDGISAVFAVNTLAPYILTCLMDKPTSRLLFMSSDSHWGGRRITSWRWDDIQVISMHPGWVRTKMGGMAAPGSVSSSAKALAGWASGENSLSKVKSGAFVTTGGETSPHSDSEVVDKQEELMSLCKRISGSSVPGE
ncbi:uncharacterized protein N7469_008711 [Penicillium citrinum]|uniref:Uncharacterized protein n=1 Tax=Penicillium citrinum TaxID=5077 RepID=A0A9W9TH27_PENCI|nr:uncharacterized protein N7469_008711 [Penicillium citrinum]KAJ5222471.1 hypothetical protein N7469_008711 [Penicillium citrinum]